MPSVGSLLRGSLLAFPGNQRRLGFNPNHVAVRGGVPRFSAAPSGVNFPNLYPKYRRPTTGGSITSLLPMGVDGLLGPCAVNTASASGNLYASQSTVNDTVITMAGIWRQTVAISGGIDGCILITASTQTAAGWCFTNHNPNGGANTLCLVNGASASVFANSALTVVVGVPYFGIASNNGTTCNFLLMNLSNGKKQTASVAGIASAAPNGTYIVGNTGFSGNPSSGNLSAVMASTAFLSLADILEWSLDPWGFWYPYPNVLLGVGASGFTWSQMDKSNESADTIIRGYYPSEIVGY